MKFIFILLLVTNLYSNKLGTDEDGVDFYCIDDYVYAHIEDNGFSLLHLLETNSCKQFLLL